MFSYVSSGCRSGLRDVYITVMHMAQYLKAPREKSTRGINLVQARL